MVGKAKSPLVGGFIAERRKRKEEEKLLLLPFVVCCHYLTILLTFPLFNRIQSLCRFRYLTVVKMGNEFHE
jgi:hypothetical protein